MPSSGVSAADRLVLDTSAYSRLRTGHPGVLDLLANASLVLLPVIVVDELEAAFEQGSRAVENRAMLTTFLAEPFVRIVEVTNEVALRYSEIMGALRRAGTPIPVNDIWIAATALVSGGHLLTFDRDFERVPDLRCTVLA